MSYLVSYSDAVDLPTLQTILTTEEPKYGPIDGIEVSNNASGTTTSVIYDISIAIEKAVTSLRDDLVVPAGQVAYTRGQASIGGVARDVMMLVLRDRTLLAQRCLSYFQSFGWTRNQSIGIVSNIRFEGDFDPAALGDDGLSYGLCQWKGGRQALFSNLGKGELKGSTFREQLEFTVWELTHSEHVAGDALRGTTTVADAADKVCRMYERPQYPDTDAPIRIKYALAIAGGGTGTV